MTAKRPDTPPPLDEANLRRYAEDRALPPRRRKMLFLREQRLEPGPDGELRSFGEAHGRGCCHRRRHGAAGSEEGVQLRGWAGRSGGGAAW